MPRGITGRTAWAGARHGGPPNDLVAILTRPARVLAAHGAHHKNHGPARRRRPSGRGTARSAGISAVPRGHWL